MKRAAIRVIIPTYNRRASLPRAIASVQTQSFPDWELVIIDDGSEDETDGYLSDLLRQWTQPQKLTLIKQKNSGVSHARNRGAENFQGHWLAFLDSDDEWLPHKLETQLHLAEQTKLPLIHGEEIWLRNGIRVNPKQKYRKTGGAIFERCVDHCCISVTTTLIARDLFESMQGFREDFKVCEDYELWLRITAKTEVAFVDSPVAIKYGGHHDQLSMQFHSMDYDRVRALAPFLNATSNADDGRKSYIARNILFRTQILSAGIRKRLAETTNDLGMQQRLSEILDWQELAKKHLNTEE